MRHQERWLSGLRSVAWTASPVVLHQGRLDYCHASIRQKARVARFRLRCVIAGALA
jgi:hypothetical protein